MQAYLETACNKCYIFSENFEHIYPILSRNVTTNSIFISMPVIIKERSLTTFQQLLSSHYKISLILYRKLQYFQNTKSLSDNHNVNLLQSICNI